MANSSATPQPATTPARCDHRSGALGCARSAGHDGSHWLTGRPEAARAALHQQGIRA